MTHLEVGHTHGGFDVNPRLKLPRHDKARVAPGINEATNTIGHLKLLYFSHAFPPGAPRNLAPINPAGHAFETGLVQALSNHFQVRSIGLLPGEARGVEFRQTGSEGIAHDLTLFEYFPDVWSRLNAVVRIKQAYRRWSREGWEPDAVMTYNLSPVFNAIIRWLRAQSHRPTRIVLLADSSRLGWPMPPLKALRYRLKPLVVPDAQAIRWFDACIGLSRTSERFFCARNVPFLWMPGACRSSAAIEGQDADATTLEGGPTRFGYFGALADHSGVLALIRLFRSTAIAASLQICGYGKLAQKVAQEAAKDSRIRFHGFLSAPADCLVFGRTCDVLVNPRPATHGNENNFPSKIFDYALCSRAILSSTLGGVDAVLGNDATYFEPADFGRSLTDALTELVKTPRAELRRRGLALKRRVLSEYSWEKQADHITDFIRECQARRR